LAKPRVTVIIPTLAADEALDACLDSLTRQEFRDFETVVVDNSGRGAVIPRAGIRVLSPPGNLGFGAGINYACRRTASELIAVLNDDAVASPAWLSELVRAADTNPRAGMFASCVLLGDTGLLDSAGMLLCADGIGKQRGHRETPSGYPAGDEVLFPSGSAALYRRSMLDDVGLFEESFFLYCEDTDLGLRGQWAGWKCRYVPGAAVTHRYSHSAGRASPLKAFLVERNRLFVVIRNFPLRMLLAAPTVSFLRYLYHAGSVLSGNGAAGEFTGGGRSPVHLAWILVRAHLAALFGLGRLTRERWNIAKTRRVGSGEFTAIARRFAISPRDVARH
jgi:GT2 family glycosyltransferase